MLPKPKGDALRAAARWIGICLRLALMSLVILPARVGWRVLCMVGRGLGNAIKAFGNTMIDAILSGIPKATRDDLEMVKRYCERTISKMDAENGRPKT